MATFCKKTRGPCRLPGAGWQRGAAVIGYDARQDATAGLAARRAKRMPDIAPVPHQ
jgi:hypothetical protein